MCVCLFWVFFLCVFYSSQLSIKKRPGQAGKLGREEPDEVQEGEVQGPAPGEEQPHALAQAGDRPAGDEPCGEGPGCAGG